MLMNPRLFILPHSEIRQNGLQALTYGSLTMRGLEKTVNAINRFMEEPVSGFDLGCGDGELMWHLGQAIPDSYWEGVEISAHRVDQQIRDVCIWQGDMLKECFRPYNVLHADNLCLDDSTADELEEKIAYEFKGLYITYRKPASLVFLERAIHLETVITETTWAEHPIHYYWL